MDQEETHAPFQWMGLPDSQWQGHSHGIPPARQCANKKDEVLIEQTSSRLAVHKEAEDNGREI